tara:strand:- start:742 stop:1239 length:498 start_codon:yes stop_codon:yes gene_type:complete
VKAEKNYTFFDIELGVPLKNEDILTGEYDIFWEVFKPTKINKTFNKYLLLRGLKSKTVYGILVTGKQESFSRCIKNKNDFWENFFIKKFPFVKKNLLNNTNSEYSHELEFKNKLIITIKCLDFENEEKLYIEILYDRESKIKEDNEYYNELSEERLNKDNDTTGF